MAPKPLIAFAAAALACAGLSACSPTVAYTGFQAREEQPRDVKVGVDTKSTVLGRLGSPSVVSTFEPNIWFYISQVSSQVAYKNPKLRSRDIVAISFSDDEKVKAVQAYDASKGYRIAYAKDLAIMQRAFAAATSDLVPPAEWRVADASFGTAADRIVEQGHCADLVVLTQADPEWTSSALLEDPERVILSVGRPVLLVPNSGSVAAPPKRVSVAWNGRREAARAVFDALPLLQHAEIVDVIGVNSGQDVSPHGDLPAAEICAALARHGVKCQSSEASAGSGEVGHELLRQAKAFGADLLVMGCYGHSRLREFVLGGASRHVLRHMHLPVLLSH